MKKRMMAAVILTSAILISPNFVVAEEEVGNASEEKVEQVPTKNEPIIFPKEGQSKEQITGDKAYCKTWAEEETGVDPGVLEFKIEEIEEEATTEKQTKMGGLLEGIFKGAATGAAVGAIEQNIDNEVGSDAVKGAVLGGMLKHEKQVDKKEELEYRKGTYTKEELEGQFDRFMRAYAVCLEAKGYTVK